MKKNFVLTTLFITFLTLSIASGGGSESNKTSSSSIKWYRIDEGLTLAKEQGKHIVVFFYTDWCHWCRTMNLTTYADKRVIAKLRKNFIAVKVNAESKNIVEYRGNELSEAQLAIAFRVFGYPATFFIEPNNEMIGRVPGYIQADELLNLADYIAGNFNEKMEYDRFLATKLSPTH